MKRKVLLTAAVALTCTVAANNPIIHDQYTADPTARVFDGKLYLYPSHDIPSPVERLKDWFCMADYHVFSSENLTDWTDHGVILSQQKVPWGNPEGYSMWAPDCVKKGDMYYFYFPDAPADTTVRGFNIGVAISHKPTGPFMALPHPIKNVAGIDPCVLCDDDGQSYLFWSGRGLNVARLKDNMTEIDSEILAIEGLPEGFKEGPFAFKRDGRYYLTFPWVRKNTETLAYAMSDSPMGPYEFKGLIMDESPTGCWTNHHSIVEYDGQWYLFYHHNDYSPEFDKNRSARIDKIYFNPDGTIQKVTPTLRGVGIADARHAIEIDRYSAISKSGIKTTFKNPDNKFEGWKTIFSKKGAWVRYNDVDFGDKAYKTVNACAISRKGAVIQVKATGKDGKVVIFGNINIKPSKSWAVSTAAMPQDAPTGINDLTVTLIKGDAEIDYIGFGATPRAQGAFATGTYRNLLEEMGYDPAEIDKKVHGAFHDMFFGENRVYFEVGDSLGYVSDLKNHDVRTEGMSYGMMAAVQFGYKDIFDRLWRWSKKYMQHQSGPCRSYFAWSCKTDGTPNSDGAASDGELYFITSLIFASNRWGNDTGINYLAEAQRILDDSMSKTGMNESAPLINLEHQLITFTPDPYGGRFTDPSYHLPAFYEVWARYADDGRSGFWMQCAAKSREYLHKSIHPVTGLNPDYNNYDGSLRGSRGVIGDQFRYDSWRVPMNIALDYSWSCADRDWQQEYADRIQTFLYGQGLETFVDQYNVDGTTPERILSAGGYTKLRHSLGLVATSAAVSLAATDERSREFVQQLWDARHEPYEDGYFDAYFDGFMRLFALMHLSGNYRIITPQQNSDQNS